MKLAWHMYHLNSFYLPKNGRGNEWAGGGAYRNHQKMTRNSQPLHRGRGVANLVDSNICMKTICG